MLDGPSGTRANGITAHPEEAAAIREGAKAVLSGVSLRQISRDWNAAGLRTSFGANEFNTREVRKILLRPRNAGISLLDDGKDDKGVKRVKRVPNGQWDTILDPDTFAAVEALLRDPSRGAHVSTERKYQGSGVYRCGKCGASMIAAAHNKTALGWTRTYTC